jgi:hypothetical protein
MHFDQNLPPRSHVIPNQQQGSAVDKLVIPLTVEGPEQKKPVIPTDVEGTCFWVEQRFQRCI